MKNRGSSSLNLLIVFFFLLLAFSGLGGYLSRSSLLTKRIEMRLTNQRELEMECRKVLDVLCSDSTPEYNTDQDEVWDYVDLHSRDGLELGLKDVSSLLRKNSSDRSLFSSLWNREDFFTNFSWINSHLSPDSGKPFPFTNDLPLYNIYYMPKEILKLCLDSPYHGKRLENQEFKLQKILSEVKDQRLTYDSLKTILAVDDERAIYYMSYLGMTTWFWEIRAEREGYGHVLIAARLPERGAVEKTLNQPPRYQIIKSYSEDINALRGKKP